MTQKQCPKCGRKDQIDKLFGKNKCKNDDHQSVCKHCKNQLHKEYKRPQSSKIKKKETTKLVRMRNKEHLFQYLLNHPCIDCGESDPVVLEFDHRKEKEKDLSDLILRTVSIEMINSEISKCEVRCVNCHRRKTAKERGYFRITA